MKSCPTCNRTFPDDTLAFCLVDGAILSAPYDPEATQAFPFPHNTDRTKAAKTIPSTAPQPIFTPDTNQNQSSEKRSKKSSLIFGVLIILVLVTGLIIGLGWNSWFGKSSQEKESSAGTQNDNNTLTVTSTSAKPSATPTASPQSTPSPKTTPLEVRKIDITGNWTGTFANRDAYLFINSQSGNSFSGILKNSKGALIAISGRVNPDSRQISMQENRVVEEVKEGPDWILGTNSGSVSADGKGMSGSGKDKAGHSYSWTFTK